LATSTIAAVIRRLEQLRWHLEQRVRRMFASATEFLTRRYARGQYEKNAAIFEVVYR